MEIRQAQFCVRMKFLLLILRMPVWSMLEKNNNGTTNNNLKNILKIKKQKKKRKESPNARNVHSRLKGCTILSVGIG